MASDGVSTEEDYYGVIPNCISLVASEGLKDDTSTAKLPATSVIPNCIPERFAASEKAGAICGKAHEYREDSEADTSTPAPPSTIPDDLEVAGDAAELDFAPLAEAEPVAHLLNTLPDGVTLWKSFLLSFVVCVVSGTLQFVAIPNSNPLKDPQRKGIWHCAVGCSVVWMPISMLYIVFMTERWVLRGSGVSVMLTDLALMWAFAAVFFACSVLFWNSIWLYPFPYGGIPSAVGGLIALGSVMWALLFKRFRKRGLPTGQFKALLFKGIMVFVVFLWSLIVLVVIMLLLGASQYMPAIGCAVIFPAARHFAKSVSERLLRNIDEEAMIVAENLTMTSFGIGLTLLVGNRGNIHLAIGIAVVDLAVGLVTSLQMFDNKLLRWFLQARARCKPPTDAAVERAIEVGKATFIAAEVGEIIVPITCVVVVLIVHSGPYAGAFTGIGTTDFGVKPPKEIKSFLKTMAVLIVCDFVGALVLKFLVNYMTGLNSIAEMRKFYQKYGLILTVQNIWIIHTAFCAVMIQCGLDYSYRLDEVHR